MHEPFVFHDLSLFQLVYLMLTWNSKAAMMTSRGAPQHWARCLPNLQGQTYSSMTYQRWMQVDDIGNLHCDLSTYDGSTQTAECYDASHMRFRWMLNTFHLSLTNKLMMSTRESMIEKRLTTSNISKNQKPNRSMNVQIQV